MMVTWILFVWSKFDGKGKYWQPSMQQGMVFYWRILSIIMPYLLRTDSFFLEMNCHVLETLYLILKNIPEVLEVNS